MATLERGQEIYDDCSEVLYNATNTRAEAGVYIRELHQLMCDDTSETEIYVWLKETTEKIYNQGE